MIRVIQAIGAFLYMPTLHFPITGIANTFNLLQQVESAKLDASVTEVVFLIHSTGGAADGVPELMDAIYTLSMHKPTLAYIVGNAQSAGLYIATQCNKVVATDSASIGALGAVFQGVRPPESVTYLTNKSARFKAAVAPWEGEALEYMRGRVEELAQSVNSRVLRSMPILPSEAFSGKVFSAPRALELGLIHGISPISENLNLFT